MLVWVAAEVTLHNATGLLGAAGARGTADHSGGAITGTQALTLFAIPELLATLPVAALVVASTADGWHTLVAAEEEAIITLAPFLAHSGTEEGEGQAGAGGGA